MAEGPTWNAGTPSTGRPFADGSDAYANAGYVISFEHLPSENAVFFKAFITAFNETFASDWASESVYGRSDPIYMFKQTKRDINLAFKIPASTREEAFKNLSSVQQLTQFLYPSYQNPGEAQTITQSPLIRLKIMNFLKTNTTTAGVESVNDYTNTSGGTNSTYGLLGVITNIAIDHSLADADGVVELGGGTLLSKIIEINLNFSAVHEHPLGWGADGFSIPSFPYGANAFGSAADIPASSATSTNTSDADSNSAETSEIVGGNDSDESDFDAQHAGEDEP